MKGSYRQPLQLSLLTEFEQRDDYPTLFSRCSGMRSVPPRGSGWVLAPSGEFTALMRDSTRWRVANLRPIRYRVVVLTKA
jgi:hypothetical protein